MDYKNTVYFKRKILKLFNVERDSFAEAYIASFLFLWIAYVVWIIKTATFAGHTEFLQNTTGGFLLFCFVVFAIASSLSLVVSAFNTRCISPENEKFNHLESLFVKVDPSFNILDHNVEISNIIDDNNELLSQMRTEEKVLFIFGKIYGVSEDEDKR